MALRKISTPYTNFQPSTKILSEQFNTNFDEVEYCFNQLYDDYALYKTNVYLKTEVDANILTSVTNAKTEVATNLTNEITDVNTSIDNLYLSNVRITDNEIASILTEIPADYELIEYITTEQILSIIG